MDSVEIMHKPLLFASVHYAETKIEPYKDLLAKHNLYLTTRWESEGFSLSMQLRFDDEAICIMLITGHNLRYPDGVVIDRIAHEIVSQDTHTKDCYHGNACGKYDSIVEFRNPTAKVARYLLNSIRKGILRELPKNRRLCTSVILGSRVIAKNESIPDDAYEKPIRTYSLLRTRSHRLVKMSNAVRDINSNSRSRNATMRLVWTDSVFSVLITSADDLRDAFRSIRSFIKKTKVDCCTIASLRYGQRDLKREIDSTDPYAIVLAKLKTEKPLEISQRVDFMSFSAPSSIQPLCLGDYGRCLITNKVTLDDILGVTRRLRTENQRNLLHTATILLMEQ